MFCLCGYWLIWFHTTHKTSFQYKIMQGHIFELTFCLMIQIDFNWVCCANEVDVVGTTLGPHWSRQEGKGKAVL